MRARLRMNVLRLLDEDVGGQFGCASASSSSFARHAAARHNRLHKSHRHTTLYTHNLQYHIVVGNQSLLENIWK